MIKAILLGCFTLLTGLISFSFIITIIIYFFSLTNLNLQIIAFLLYLIIVLISGFIAGLYSEEKGWLIGIIIGVISICFIFFIKSPYQHTFFTLSDVSFAALIIICAITGSIIGLNTVLSSQEK